MGLVGAAFGLGFTLGPLIGGELVKISMGAPGFFAAGFSGFAALFGLLRLREPAVHRPEGSRRFNMAIVGQLFSDAKVRTILYLYFASILAFSAFETMFIRFGLAKFPEVFYEATGELAANDNASLEQVLKAAPIAGRYLFFIGLISAVVQGGLIRRLVPRFGEVKLIVAGPILLGISLAIIGVAHAWWLVIAGCVFMPFGLGFNNPSLHSLLSRSAPTHLQGATLGLNQSLASLARVTGPLMAAFAFSNFGPESPMLLAAGILFLAAIVAHAFGKKFGANFSAQ